MFSVTICAFLGQVSWYLMQVKDFSFELQDELIARYPLAERSASRLLSLDGATGELKHGKFVDILAQVNSGDLMVFNDTRVIPARLFGHKLSGGKIEILIERILDEQRALAHVRASRSPLVNSWLQLDSGEDVQVVGRQGNLFELYFKLSDSLLGLLEQVGHMPLPPYIKRADEQLDKERYQTVYNRVSGAIAAPTAGLHFDEDLLLALDNKGVERGFVTLHVGAGTFQPVKVEQVEQHKMHSEYIEVGDKLCQQVEETCARGGRVIAVGTTSVRSLESASRAGKIEPFYGDTDIFIYPGYKFQVVNAMLTNFHLPQSTLLMLVSAFAGVDNIRKAYAEAIAQQYRFFSYGDAMYLSSQQTKQGSK